MRIERVLVAVATAMVGVVMACGSGSSPPAAPADQPDASDSGVASVADAQPDILAMAPDTAPPAYPAFKPAMPQIVTGGGVLAKPNVVNVSFAGDPLEGDIDTFASAMQGTSYWGDRTKEYGIAPLTVGARIHDPTVWAATTDDTAIQTWLTGQLAGDAGVAAGWPAPDANTVYVLYFPPGITVTMQGTGTSCVDFHGYHSNIALPGGQLVPYAVISRCASIPEDTAATGIQYVSAVVSHEAIEAITDPFITSVFNNTPAGGTPKGLGWAGTDPAHVALEYVTSEELMDLCTLIPDGSGHGAFYTPPDFPYLMQRGWSNLASSQWKDPCLPVPAGEVYFDSVPVLPDMVTIPDVFGVSVPTQGVKLAVGQTKTIEIDLLSEGPTSGPWTVRAVEDATSSLTLTLDKKTGQNGDKLNLTIKVNDSKAGGAEFVLLISSLGTQGAFSPFVVLN